jgi:3-oxoacyl-[acyl-carrier-protein] synthase II
MSADKYRAKPTVVITGMGAVTPYGEGVEVLWQSLLEGVSAISDMDLFDLGGIACTRAGVIRGFTPPPGFERAPRASAFAAAACREALQQAGLLEDSAALEATALITASNFADIGAAEAALTPYGQADADISAALHCAHAAPAAAIAEALGLGGPRLPLSLSCASGASAAATAANLIVAGHVGRVLLVGYDAISRFAWSGLCSLRTMSREQVRPFDINRNGTIFSEGATALLLERTDLCAARASAPLAVLSGWASGNNGHHMTAPAPRGAGSEYVMRRALECAGLQPADIDHINAHGTATKPNDSTEAQAIQDLFGDRAASIPVTSVKGLLGHMLGAAGAVECVISVLSLQRGVIPPTGNLEHPDPECPLDVVTAPRTQPLACVLSNSAGFGGCNAALVLSRAPEVATSVLPHFGNLELPSPVLITGLGVTSALGADALEHAAALKEGEPALFPLDRFELPELPEPPLAGEAPDPDLAACGVSPKAYLDRNSALFLAACGMALQQAGLDAMQLAELEAGVMCGTAWGCLATAESFFADYVIKGPRLVKPFLFPHAYPNSAVSLAAIEWSLKGAHENVAGFATASGIALVEAFDLIAAGRQHLIMAGGAEALSATLLRARGANGTGAPCGEAGAVMILESEASATGRGAKPLGQMLACCLAATPAAAATAAMEQAGLNPEALTAVYMNNAARVAGDLFPAATLHLPETLCGDVQGATAALHLAFALLSEHSGPVMILSAETGTCTALIVRMNPNDQG